MIAQPGEVEQPGAAWTARIREVVGLGAQRQSVQSFRRVFTFW